MQKGNILAAGTPFELKAAFGGGFRLTLTTPADPAIVKPPTDSAVLESAAADQVVWRISDANELVDVVRWADSPKHSGNEVEDGAMVEGWEISMPTLEDVLLEHKLF